MRSDHLSYDGNGDGTTVPAVPERVQKLLHPQVKAPDSIDVQCWLTVGHVVFLLDPKGLKDFERVKSLAEECLRKPEVTQEVGEAVPESVIEQVRAHLAALPLDQSQQIQLKLNHDVVPNGVQISLTGVVSYRDFRKENSQRGWRGR